MANKVESILEEIKGLTLLEAADLVKKMEETFGVSAAAAPPGVVAAGGGGGVRHRPRKRRNFRLCSPKWEPTRSTLSRPSAKSPALASRRPRTLWTALP